MRDNMIVNMLDNNESILWEGKPDRITYIIGHPAFYIFALFWGLIDSSFIVTVFNSENIPAMVIPFFAIHLAPVWIALGGPIYRAINWNFVQYVMTGKRIYILSGVIGRDVKVIEFSDITDPSVNVGLIEKVRNCGTIHLKPYNEYSRRNQRSNSSCVLHHVEEPYDLYKQIKQMALDIRTDTSYPNAMRPDVNPGYNTQYTGPNIMKDNDVQLF